MIATGQRVRHRKQPAWGVGRVAQIAKVGGLIELVIDFESGGERRLKLKPDVVDAMIEPLSAEDNAAVDTRVRAKAAVADAEAVARREGMRSKKHAARARVSANCLAAIATGDDHLLAAVQDEGVRELRVYAPDGSLAETIAIAMDTPTDLVTDGQGLFIGTRTHTWGMAIFARRGQKSARLWTSPVELGITYVTPLPGIGAIVFDRAHLLIVREDGTTSEVPLELEAKRTIGSAAPWGDGILVGTHGEGAANDYFQFVYLGLDGTVRHRGSGIAPAVVDDELMIAFDRGGVLSRDRTGTAAGRLEVPASWPSSIGREEVAFARVDDELAFTLADRNGLVRWHPRVDGPRWVTPLAGELEGLQPPVRVGRFLAATQSQYTSNTSPRVWIVDADTGARVHVLDLRAPASALVPVGDDNLVTLSYSKQPVAWRGLSRDKPERITLTHATECMRIVALASGVVATYDRDSVSFFDL